LVVKGRIGWRKGRIRLERVRYRAHADELMSKRRKKTVIV